MVTPAYKPRTTEEAGRSRVPIQSRLLETVSETKVKNRSNNLLHTL